MIKYVRTPMEVLMEIVEEHISFFYHRVSVAQQHLDRGIAELKEFASTNNIKKMKFYTDKYTGTNFDRPEYKKLKKRIKPGDVLVITEMDRLGRNKEEILKELQWFKNHNIQVKILEIPTTLMDFSSFDNELAEIMAGAINSILIELYAAFAQFEMEKRKKRQKEGIAAKKARGEWDDYGRPRKVPLDVFAKALNTYSKEEILEKYDISSYTYYKYIKELNMLNEQKSG